MKCPRCQLENPAHARFCLGCGARLALACASCGTELPGGARFCLQCGHAVATGVAVASLSRAREAYAPKHLAEKIRTSGARRVLARVRGGPQLVRARGVRAGVTLDGRRARTARATPLGL